MDINFLRLYFKMFYEWLASDWFYDYISFDYINYAKHNNYGYYCISSEQRSSLMNLEYFVTRIGPYPPPSPSFGVLGCHNRVKIITLSCPLLYINQWLKNRPVQNYVFHINHFVWWISCPKTTKYISSFRYLCLLARVSESITRPSVWGASVV